LHLGWVLDILGRRAERRVEQHLQSGDGAAFVNDDTGETSASWPTSFQNEARFGPYYGTLCKRTAQALGQLTQPARTHAQAEPAAALEFALRALKAPLLLRESRMLDEEGIQATLIASRAAVQSYVGFGAARVLFIVGHPWDWYHHTLGYELPPWLQTGAAALLPHSWSDDEAHGSSVCNAWGWERPSLTRLLHDGTRRTRWDARVSAEVAIAAFICTHFDALVELYAL
jgi:hypothetical protein